MCGYACVNCGLCKGENRKPQIALENIKGYCMACGFLNGALDRVCKKCGAELEIKESKNSGVL